MATTKRPIKVEVVEGTSIGCPRAWVRIRSSNGRIMLDSEVYTYSNAVRAARNLHALIPNSVLVLPK